MSSANEKEINKKELESFDYGKLYRVLKIPIRNRGSDSVAFLQKYLEKIEFFKNYIEENNRGVIEECCQFVTYEHNQTGDVIFHIDEEGEKFYILLQGQVGIYVRKNLRKIAIEQVNMEEKQNEGEGVEDEQKEEEGTNNNNTNGENKNNNFVQIDAQNETQSGGCMKHIKNVHKYGSNCSRQVQELVNDMIIVKVLETGDSFGEMSIITQQRRLATVVAHSECHFAVIDKESFQKILQKSEKQKFYRKIEWFVKIPLFSNFDYFQTKMLYLNSHIVNLIKGDIIYQEGYPVDAIYIIKGGNVIIQKKYKISYNNDDDDINEIQSADFKELSQMPFREASSPFRRKPYTIQMNFLGVKEIFGEEDFIMNNQKRSHSAICESAEAEIMIIRKRDFLNRIYSDECGRLYLKERCKQKWSKWQQKYEKFKESLKNKQALIQDNSKIKDSLVEVSTIQRHKELYISDASPLKRRFQQKMKESQSEAEEEQQKDEIESQRFERFKCDSVVERQASSPSVRKQNSSVPYINSPLSCRSQKKQRKLYLQHSNSNFDSYNQLQQQKEEEVVVEEEDGNNIQNCYNNDYRLDEERKEKKRKNLEKGNCEKAILSEQELLFNLEKKKFEEKQRVLQYQKFLVPNFEIKAIIDSDLKDLVHDSLENMDRKEEYVQKKIEFETQEKIDRLWKEYNEGKRKEPPLGKQFINPQQKNFSDTLVREYMKKCRDYKKKNNLGNFVNAIKEYPTLSFPQDMVERQEKKMQFDEEACKIDKCQGNIVKIDKIRQRVQSSRNYTKCDEMPQSLMRVSTTIHTQQEEFQQQYQSTYSDSVREQDTGSAGNSQQKISNNNGKKFFPGSKLKHSQSLMHSHRSSPKSRFGTQVCDRDALVVGVQQSKQKMNTRAKSESAQIEYQIKTKYSQNQYIRRLLPAEKRNLTSSTVEKPEQEQKIKKFQRLFSAVKSNNSNFNKYDGSQLAILSPSFAKAASRDQRQNTLETLKSDFQKYTHEKFHSIVFGENEIQKQENEGQSQFFSPQENLLGNEKTRHFSFAQKSPSTISSVSNTKHQFVFEGKNEQGKFLKSIAASQNAKEWSTSGANKMVSRLESQGILPKFSSLHHCHNARRVYAKSPINFSEIFSSKEFAGFNNNKAFNKCDLLQKNFSHVKKRQNGGISNSNNNNRNFNKNKKQQQQQQQQQQDKQQRFQRFDLAVEQEYYTPIQ